MENKFKDTAGSRLIYSLISVIFNRFFTVGL